MVISFFGSKVFTVGIQWNNFLQLIKVVEQWKFDLNLCHKVILYAKSLFLLRYTPTLKTSTRKVLRMIRHFFYISTMVYEKREKSCL